MSIYNFTTFSYLPMAFHAPKNTPQFSVSFGIMISDLQTKSKFVDLTITVSFPMKF